MRVYLFICSVDNRINASIIYMLMRKREEELFMNYPEYITTNRMLENFMYYHRIPFIRQGKTDSGQTYWVYSYSPRFDSVFNEYRKIWCDHTPERMVDK